MKKGRLLQLFSIVTLAAAGVFGVVSNKSSNEVETVEAGSVTKNRSVFEIIDETNATRDAGGNPIMHLWNVSVDSSMEYSSGSILSEMDAAGCVNDFEDFNGQWRTINTSDSYIETSFTWEKEENGKRYWNLRLPWYVTSFDFKVRCGNMYSNTSNYVSGVGCYNIYLFAQSGDCGWYSQSLTSYSGSNSVSVTNYAISASTTGGAPGSANTAQVKGNGGSYVSSGNYFARQRISLKATAGTYSAFDHWNYGHSTSSSSTYDYVGTANKAYVATFSDTRQKFTVTFKDYDGTTLETKTNQYQGSSVSITTTPTRATEGKIVYTFDHWEDSSGNDKTSALANLQSNLTVYAVYSVSYKAGFYVYGDFGVSPTWSVETAFLLTEFSEQSYAWSAKATIYIPYGSVFKLRYYNTAWYNDQEFDTRNLQNDSPAKYCYDCSRADFALQCYASGTYTIILHNFDGKGKTFYINFENESRTAEQLAAYLMSFGTNPQSGTCGDGRFANAKNMFLNQLSSSEKNIFQGYHSDGNMQFRNAYNRYVAWAAALGQNPWSSGAANSSAILLRLNQETTNSVAILIFISIVSISSVGGYFFYKKRKENN